MERSEIAVNPHKRLLKQIVGSMIVRYSAANESPQVRTQVPPDRIGARLSLHRIPQSLFGGGGTQQPVGVQQHVGTQQATGTQQVGGAQHPCGTQQPGGLVVSVGSVFIVLLLVDFGSFRLTLSLSEVTDASDEKKTHDF
jgi:hypothetical protein